MWYEAMKSGVNRVDTSKINSNGSNGALALAKAFDTFSDIVKDEKKLEQDRNNEKLVNAYMQTDAKNFKDFIKDNKDSGADSTTLFKIASDMDNSEATKKALETKQEHFKKLNELQNEVYKLQDDKREQTIDNKGKILKKDKTIFDNNNEFYNKFFGLKEKTFNNYMKNNKDLVSARSKNLKLEEKLAKDNSSLKTSDITKAFKDIDFTGVNGASNNILNNGKINSKDLRGAYAWGIDNNITDPSAALIGYFKQIEDLAKIPSDFR
jgi:hypothetical protein